MRLRAYKSGMSRASAANMPARGMYALAVAVRKLANSSGTAAFTPVSHLCELTKPASVRRQIIQQWLTIFKLATRTPTLYQEINKVS